MTLRTRTALLLVFGLSFSALAASSFAAPPKPFLFAPGEPYGLPKFGFSSSSIQGYGERVVSVRYGGRAHQLGLESGDVILSINGYRLTYPGSWNDGLSQALYNNNLVRLKIRDVRTGNVYVRQTYVNYGGSGPVQHYKKSNKNFTSFPQGDHHHNGSPVKTIKEIKNLFD
jgi:predicted metalloprotease with PDZ domain